MSDAGGGPTGPTVAADFHDGVGVAWWGSSPPVPDDRAPAVAEWTLLIDAPLSVGPVSFGRTLLIYRRGALAEVSFADLRTGTTDELRLAIAQAHGPPDRVTTDSPLYRWTDGPLRIDLADNPGTLTVSRVAMHLLLIGGLVDLPKLVAWVNEEDAAPPISGEAYLSCSHELSRDEAAVVAQTLLAALGHIATARRGDPPRLLFEAADRPLPTAVLGACVDRGRSDELREAGLLVAELHHLVIAAGPIHFAQPLLGVY